MNHWTCKIRKVDPSLIAILAAAVVFRVWGITHDLPYVYYPDERHWVNRSLAFGSGDLNPHWFHKPALYMYLLFFEYGLYYVIGRAFGWFLSVDDFAREYFTDPSVFFIIGRLTAALFGIATVYLIYLIGRSYGARRIGLIAALFLAVTFGHVQSSQYVLSDVPTAFWTVLSFLFLAKVTETARTRDYILAGLFAGLGTATKYYSVILLPSLYLAHISYQWNQGKCFWKKIIDAKIVAAVGCWALGFFIGSPYNFLDPFWFKSNILPIFTGGMGTAVDMKLDNSLYQLPLALFHIWEVVIAPKGMGLLMGALAFAGVGYLAVQYSAKKLVLLSAILTFIIVAVLVSPFYAQSRHINPIYPFLCLAAAIITERVLNQRWLKARVWAAGLFCIVLVVPSTYRVVWNNYWISQRDTRTIAKEWIERNIPADTKILLDENGPPLSASAKNLKDLYEQSKRETRVGPFTTHLERYFYYQLQATNRTSYDITYLNHPWWKKAENVEISDVDRDMGNPLWNRAVMPFEFYQANRYRYVITTSENYTGYLDGFRKETFPSFRAFYRDLFAKGTLVKEFEPYTVKRPGPVVKIFRIDPAVTPKSFKANSHNF